MEDAIEAYPGYVEEAVDMPTQGALKYGAASNPLTDSISGVEQGAEERPTQAYFQYVEENRDEATPLYV